MRLFTSDIAYKYTETRSLVEFDPREDIEDEATYILTVSRILEVLGFLQPKHALVVADQAMVDMGLGMSGWLLSNVYPQLTSYGLQKIALISLTPISLPPGIHTPKIKIEVFLDRDRALEWLG